MPTITTIERWIDLPASGGANDRFRADQPLGSGLVQIASSNAEWAARENGLRTLWESPGQGNVEGTLGFGTSIGTAVNVDQFPWDDDPADSGSALVYYAGTHCIRTHGSTGRLPLIVLACRLSNGGGSTAGVVFAACDRPRRPHAGDLMDYATTTSGSLVTKTVTLSPVPAQLGSRATAPQDERTTPSPPPDEQGRDTTVSLWVGVWTDGSGKSNVRGLSIYLAAP